MITPTNTIADTDHNTLDTVASLADILAYAIERLPESERMPHLPAELHRLSHIATEELNRRCGSEDGAA